MGLRADAFDGILNAIKDGDYDTLEMASGAFKDILFDEYVSREAKDGLIDRILEYRASEEYNQKYGDILRALDQGYSCAECIAEHLGYDESQVDRLLNYLQYEDRIKYKKGRYVIYLPEDRK